MIADDKTNAIKYVIDNLQNHESNENATNSIPERVMYSLSEKEQEYNLKLIYYETNNTKLSNANQELIKTNKENIKNLEEHQNAFKELEAEKNKLDAQLKAANGEYDASINQLTAENAQLNSAVKELTTKNESLETQNKEQLEALEKQLVDLRTKNDTLTEELKRLKPTQNIQSQAEPESQEWITDITNILNNYFKNHEQSNGAKTEIKALKERLKAITLELYNKSPSFGSEPNDELLPTTQLDLVDVAKYMKKSLTSKTAEIQSIRDEIQPSQSESATSTDASESGKPPQNTLIDLLKGRLKSLLDEPDKSNESNESNESSTINKMLDAIQKKYKENQTQVDAILVKLETALGLDSEDDSADANNVLLSNYKSRVDAIIQKIEELKTKQNNAEPNASVNPEPEQISETVKTILLNLMQENSNLEVNNVDVNVPDINLSKPENETATENETVPAPENKTGTDNKTLKDFVRYVKTLQQTNIQTLENAKTQLDELVKPYLSVPPPNDNAENTDGNGLLTLPANLEKIVNELKYTPPSESTPPTDSTTPPSESTTTPSETTTTPSETNNIFNLINNLKTVLKSKFNYDQTTEITLAELVNKCVKQPPVENNASTEVETQTDPDVYTQSLKEKLQTLINKLKDKLKGTDEQETSDVNSSNTAQVSVKNHDISKDPESNDEVKELENIINDLKIKCNTVPENSSVDTFVPNVLNKLKKSTGAANDGESKYAFLTGKVNDTNTDTVEWTVAAIQAALDQPRKNAPDDSSTITADTCDMTSEVDNVVDNYVNTEVSSVFEGVGITVNVDNIQENEAASDADAQKPTKTTLTFTPVTFNCAKDNMTAWKTKITKLYKIIVDYVKSKRVLNPSTLQTNVIADSDDSSVVSDVSTDSHNPLNPSNPEDDNNTLAAQILELKRKLDNCKYTKTKFNADIRESIGTLLSQKNPDELMENYITPNIDSVVKEEELSFQDCAKIVAKLTIAFDNSLNEINEKNSKCKENNTELTDAKSENAETIKTLTAEKSNLESANNKLDEELTKAKTDNEQNIKNLTEEKIKLESAKKELTNAKTEITGLQAKHSNLESAYNELESKKPAFCPGESGIVIADGVVYIRKNGHIEGLFPNDKKLKVELENGDVIKIDDKIIKTDEELQTVFGSPEIEIELSDYKERLKRVKNILGNAASGSITAVESLSQ